MHKLTLIKISQLILILSLTLTNIIPNLTVSAVSQNIFKSELGTNSIGSITDIVGNFNVIKGSVDSVSSNNIWGINTNGNTFIDLNGDSSGSISTGPLSYFSGNKLLLSFQFQRNFDPNCPVEPSFRSANVSVGGVKFVIPESDKSGTFSQSFVAIEGGKTPLIFTSDNGGPCGVMIGNVVLDELGPDPIFESVSNGGTITIGNSTVSTSSSTSLLLSSSTTSNSESQSSILGNSKNSGVLAFEAQKTESSNSSFNSNTIDPSKTKILVTTEAKNVIDSAKGGTSRTGGF